MDDGAGGVPEEAAEAKAAFHLRMRARGVRDVDVLRAFERVPRATFLVQACRGLASRDLALPIGCGQTMMEPGVLARMIEALAVGRSHKVLEIGSGSGYATALLAQLANSVIGLERFRGLAVTARERLASLHIGNATVAWADGLAPPMVEERFDRILVHGLLDEVPTSLTRRLAERGVLVYGRAHGAGQAIVRADAGDVSGHRPVCACRLQPVRGGLAGALQATVT